MDIEENETKNKNFNILVYPNPFSNETQLLIQSKNNENIQLQIIDVFGKLQQTKTLTVMKITLLVRDWLKEIILLRLLTNLEIAIFRLVKME